MVVYTHFSLLLGCLPIQNGCVFRMGAPDQHKTQPMRAHDPNATGLDAAFLLAVGSFLLTMEFFTCK